MRHEILLWRVLLVVLLVMALPAVALAQETASGVKDFRAYVFGAYTAAFVVLFGLLAVLLARQKRIAVDIEDLAERVEKSAGPDGG